MYNSLGYSQPDNVNYYFSEFQCPIVKDYITQGEIVLLRCSHDPVRNGNISDVCPTSELAAVQCRKWSVF